MLFGDCLPDDTLEALKKRGIADPVCHEEIQNLAGTLSIVYEDIGYRATKVLTRRSVGRLSDHMINCA